MDKQRLAAILARIPDLTILVVGDYFLDQYLVIEHALQETSLETGLAAHQVVGIRSSPGAAGNVAANVRSLGAGVIALSVIGNDGRGYDLTQALQQRGIDTLPLVRSHDRFTPTYTKPMLREPDGAERELNRLDIKNRAPLPRSLEEAVIAHLRALVTGVQAVIIADQVQEPECGVITTRVRDELCALAHTNPAVVFAADSRERIGLYHGVALKPNEREAAQALHAGHNGELREDDVLACGQALWQRSGKPVFLTRGEKGITTFDGAGPKHTPAWPVCGAIDTVGAGDATLAALVAALAAGATTSEAARIATLTSAITIKQIGVTGTATRAQISDLYASAPQ